MSISKNKNGNLKRRLKRLAVDEPGNLSCSTRKLTNLGFLVHLQLTFLDDVLGCHFYFLKCSWLTCMSGNRSEYIVRKDKYLNSKSPSLLRYQSACTLTRAEINDWLSFSLLFVVVTTWTRMEIKFKIHILMAISLPLILSHSPTMTLSLYLCRPISLIDADAGA